MRYTREDIMYRADMKEAGMTCPKCHSPMKLRDNCFETWDCLNKKCKNIIIED